MVQDQTTTPKQGQGKAMLSQRYAVQANDRVWVPNPSLGDAEALKLWEVRVRVRVRARAVL